MDVDPDSDNGEDAGAIDVDVDSYHLDNHEESDDHSDSAPQSSKRRRRNGANNDPTSTRPSNLHPDNPANFLKLCMALKLLVSRKITDDQIEQASQLLRSYCQEVVNVGCRYSTSAAFH